MGAPLSSRARSRGDMRGATPAVAVVGASAFAAAAAAAAAGSSDASLPGEAFDQFPFLRATVGAMVFFYVAEQYLEVRKLRATRAGTAPPPQLAHAVSEEKFKETRDYQLAKGSFGFVTDAHALALALLLLWCGPRMWALAGAACEHIAGHDLAPTDWEVLRCVFFLGMETMMNTVASIPTKAWHTFVLQERFGFNKTTRRLWATDQVKNLFVELTLSFVMMVPMIYIVRWAGPDAWFYVWSFLAVFVCAFNALYFVLIAPLFNKFTPLPHQVPDESLPPPDGYMIKDPKASRPPDAAKDWEPSLIKNPEFKGDDPRPLVENKVRAAIDALVSRTGLNCENVFEVDGSTRSSHSNAYVGGMFGSKRIVVYDTLLSDTLKGDLGGVCAVVAHEIGHSVMQHNYVLLAVTQVNFFLMFYAYGLATGSPALVLDFGYTDYTPFLSLQIFMTLWQHVVQPLMSVVTHAVTRELEFQADRYACQLGYGADLRRGLVQINIKNLGDLTPDWLYSLWHHTHPPVAERLAAIDMQLTKGSSPGRPSSLVDARKKHE